MRKQAATRRHALSRRADVVALNLEDRPNRQAVKNVREPNKGGPAVQRSRRQYGAKKTRLGHWGKTSQTLGASRAQHPPQG